MEAQAEALRNALVKLDQIETLLNEAYMWDEDVRRPIQQLRRYLTSYLGSVESDLWTRMGLPEVPRGP